MDKHENSIESPEGGLLSNLQHDDPVIGTSAEVGEFYVLEHELSDGSCVYDVIGDSQQARITINCADMDAADEIAGLLNNASKVTGCSMEAA